MNAHLFTGKQAVLQTGPEAETIQHWEAIEDVHKMRKRGSSDGYFPFNENLNSDEKQHKSHV